MTGSRATKSELVFSLGLGLRDFSNWQEQTAMVEPVAGSPKGASLTSWRRGRAARGLAAWDLEVRYGHATYANARLRGRSTEGLWIRRTFSNLRTGPGYRGLTEVGSNHRDSIPRTRSCPIGLSLSAVSFRYGPEWQSSKMLLEYPSHRVCPPAHCRE